MDIVKYIILFLRTGKMFMVGIIMLMQLDFILTEQLYINPSNIYKEKTGKISTVKHCEKCNRQWQMRWIGPNRERYYDFYEGLPTYKMPRKVCGKCQETKH